jgi:hypothetical protein
MSFVFCKQCKKEKNKHSDKELVECSLLLIEDLKI